MAAVQPDHPARRHDSAFLEQKDAVGLDLVQDSAGAAGKDGVADQEAVVAAIDAPDAVVPAQFVASSFAALPEAREALAAAAPVVLQDRYESAEE
jgi:hypothetical protein